MFKVKKLSISFKNLSALVALGMCIQHSVYAQSPHALKNIQEHVQSLIKPQPDQGYNTVHMQALTDFSFQPDAAFTELPVIRAATINSNSTANSRAKLAVNDKVTLMANSRQLGLDEAVQLAVKRNPAIAQVIATLASQNANIEVAKAGYYPQLQAGMNTGDFTGSDKGRQIYTVQASQRLYDFGKVASSVSTQENKLIVEQANVLRSMDEISTETVRNILALLKYRAIVPMLESLFLHRRRL